MNYMRGLERKRNFTLAVTKMMYVSNKGYSFCGCALQGERDISAKPEDRVETGQIKCMGVTGKSLETVCVRGGF